MTATSHALIGTVIAAKIGNPALAIPLALASHFAMDLIPHWDTATNREKKSKRRLFIDSGLDVLMAIFLSYSIILLFFPTVNLLYAILIIIFSVLPDLLMCPYLFFNIKSFKWAYDFGKKTNTDLDKPWGIFTQIVIVVAVILLGRAI